MSRRSVLALLMLVTGLAFALRWPDLAVRPMHTDEAVHAVKCWELWAAGQYAYDPHEYHGPSLYYLTLPVIALGGARSFADTTEATYRIVPVVFGAGLILLLALVGDGLDHGCRPARGGAGGTKRPASAGDVAVLAAGGLLAVSPVFVFYSRYYIQEMLLAFFTLAALGCAWRYSVSRRLDWLLAAGGAIGLMHATKETALIAWGCAAAAAGAVCLLHRWAGSRAERSGGRARTTRDLLLAAGVAALVSVVLFSNFFQYWPGPLDSVLAYVTYFQRAGGYSVHVWPAGFYAERLLAWRADAGPWWSEAAILLLALFGIAVRLRRDRGERLLNSDTRAGGSAVFVLFLGIYAGLMAIAYSVIPYKTPWCALQIWLPVTMLAGTGVASLVNWAAESRVPAGSGGRGWLAWPAVSRLAAVALLVLAAFGHLASQSLRATDWVRSGYRNPWVYAQPVSDVPRLADWVLRLAAVHPDGRAMLVRVVAEHAWPLPWYLRGLERVGYWEEPPSEVDAPVVIATSDFEATVRARLRGGYREPVYYGMRPDLMLAVFVERGLWERFVEANAAPSPAPAKTDAVRPGAQVDLP